MTQQEEAAQADLVLSCDSLGSRSRTESQDSESRIAGGAAEAT